MVVRERLDSLLVAKGFFSSRSKARAAILEGLIEVAGAVIDKAGTNVDPEAEIKVRGREDSYVSRGALKLRKAVEDFGIEVKEKIFIDVGASTGGFTDYLLQKGTTRVIAVDVGYGQLAWKLRQDPRVQVLERQNIKYLKPEHLGEVPDAAVIDVSFISILKVMPTLLTLVKPEAEIVALVKPQFEIGKGKVEKGGVVKKKESHREVLLNLWRGLADLGLTVKGVTYSPLRGPKGNIEYFFFMRPGKSSVEEKTIAVTVERVVGEAHTALGAA